MDQPPCRLNDWTPIVELHGCFLWLQLDQARGVCHKPMHFLLQGHAIRNEECGGNVLKARK